MIKAIRATWAGDSKVALVFSDGSEGVYDFAALLAKDALLVLPLREADVFKRFFLELGALCWPNGLELSGADLHKQLSAAGKLHQTSGLKGRFAGRLAKEVNVDAMDRAIGEEVARRLARVEK